MQQNDHKKQETARLLYSELLSIAERENWSRYDKIMTLLRLIERIFMQVTAEERIHFTTMFARIAFACHRHQVERETQHWIHFFRNRVRERKSADADEKLYDLGLSMVAAAINALFGEAPPEPVRQILPAKLPWTYLEPSVEAFFPHLRVVVLADDEGRQVLIGKDERQPGHFVHIQYNIPGRNENFGKSINSIRKHLGFPQVLSLLEVETVAPEHGPLAQDPARPVSIYRPRAIVVEPDFLIDVTVIANCFTVEGPEPVLYLLNKFLPSEQSPSLIQGNIANFLLDELMHDHDASYKETFPKIFQENPLIFALLSDEDIRDLYQKSQKHWVNLKHMVQQELMNFGINPVDCFLEPAFYDEIHGLQGRLDVFHKGVRQNDIIELKSGKPFKPNREGVGITHFVQTLLYDLMVRTAFGEGKEVGCYILYSGLEDHQLRFAGRVQSEQYEAMQLRNQLIATERQMSKLGGNNAPPFFEQVKAERYPLLKGYIERNLKRFELVYSGLSPVQRRYFNAFSGFIAREHQLAKTGIQGSEFVNGLATIWLDNIEEKEEAFQLLQALRIRENKANEADAIIIFEKTAATNPLANFRAGDIAILYPRQSASREANAPYFTSQIFKVTVLDIAESTVKVRLRMRQFNLDIFKDHEEWNIEHDQMDMSFSSMYQGLFRWAECPPDKRALLLTARPPRQPEEVDAVVPDSGASWQPAGEPTEEQRLILERMLAAPDYFLLWGPPGTGKTSQMIRNFAGWIFHRTDENLLLLAYTNRAVDEICEALESLGDEVRESYMRIGSRFSTGEAFQGRLLNAKAAQVKTRKDLLALLGRHRIFVSTLASLSNNLELLRLKKFRRVVIDEASQILEPALVGLLPQFEQFVLVGDHKQLPAVVVQDETASAVKDEDLKALGLDNLRNSLFERLYRRCMSQQWDWACAHLSYQGRMHEDIMRFPGSHFYEGKLQVLPFATGQSDSWPPADLASRLSQLLRHEWQRPVLERRLAFIPTEVDQRSRSRKTNEDEALRIASLVQLFQDIYRPEAAGAGRARTIGIITPYRAQIARLRETLQQQGIDTRDITIDTVERYQGGARDIILISLCTNTAEQVKTLVSLSDEGVDRKLNVALTRAREHVVVLGNEELLATQPVYRRFVDFCRGDAGGGEP